MTPLPAALIGAAIKRLVEIGLLEIVAEPGSASRSGAGQPQAPAVGSQEGAAERKGTEHHHQEGKRTEKKRTANQGTERAQGELQREQRDAASVEPIVSKKSAAADDEVTFETVYASPEDDSKLSTRPRPATGNYRCGLCGSRVPGEGARLIDGKCVPCSCASPEWIAHQRAIVPEKASRQSLRSCRP